MYMLDLLYVSFESLIIIICAFFGLQKYSHGDSAIQLIFQEKLRQFLW